MPLTGRSGRDPFGIDPRARILITGQACGSTVTASGAPFQDASGDPMRTWMGVDEPK